MEKTKTPYMESLRDKILNTAMTAFAQQGIKAVRMDDIAKALSISKRTLYEIYDNKEKLLFEGIKRYYEVKNEEFIKLYTESSNVMEIIMHIYCMKVEEFHITSPAFYADLNKYPSVVEFLNANHDKSHDRFIGFLQRGVDEGYFRSDTNLELIAIMFNSIGEYIMNHQLYQRFTMEEMINNIVLVSLRGFCTDEGVKLLDKHFRK